MLPGPGHLCPHGQWAPQPQDRPGRGGLAGLWALGYGGPEGQRCGSAAQDSHKQVSPGVGLPALKLTESRPLFHFSSGHNRGTWGAPWGRRPLGTSRSRARGPDVAGGGACSQARGLRRGETGGSEKQHREPGSCLGARSQSCRAQPCGAAGLRLPHSRLAPFQALVALLLHQPLLVRLLWTQSWPGCGWSKARAVAGGGLDAEVGPRAHPGRLGAQVRG